MPRFFVNNNQIKDKKIEIIGTDVNHIRNVLRAKIGDDIQLCNQEEMKDYICSIEIITTEKIVCKINKVIENDKVGD